MLGVISVNILQISHLCLLYVWWCSIVFFLLVFDIVQDTYKLLNRWFCNLSVYFKKFYLRKDVYCLVFSKWFFFCALNLISSLWEGRCQFESDLGGPFSKCYVDNGKNFNTPYSFWWQTEVYEWVSNSTLPLLITILEISNNSINKSILMKMNFMLEVW